MWSLNYRANKTISQLSTENENIRGGCGVDSWTSRPRTASDDGDETVGKRATLGGGLRRRRAHRGIGPGCWPKEVGARAGRLRDCTVHHSRDRRGALALADGLVMGCLAARADTVTGVRDVGAVRGSCGTRRRQEGAGGGATGAEGEGVGYLLLSGSVIRRAVPLVSLSS